MNLKLRTSLNDLLGRELGRNVYGDPMFKWENSNDLFWPACATGKKIPRLIQVPLVGHSTCIDVEEMVPEYRKDRQMMALDIWAITRWCSPEDLILGGSRGLGRGYAEGTEPSYAALQAQWNRLFPGADFPSKGWRVPTNATLPGRENGPREPNLIDTEWFIHCIREQTSLSQEASLARDLQAQDDHQRSVDSEIDAICRDGYPALLNPHPGKRSGGWSFPAKETSADRDSALILP